MKNLSHGAVTIALAATLAMLAAPHAAALEAPERALVRAVVEVGARPDTRVDSEVARIEAGIDSIVARLGQGKPTVRRARRLHQLLHSDYLLGYDRDADTLARILDDGSFNCLSASLLYGTIARSLGYRTSALSVPGHLLIRLTIGGRAIDVETTLPDGFDARGGRSHGDPGDEPEPAASVGRAPGTREVEPPGLSMPLEAAVGFAWLNRSWHDLDDGRSVQAALGVRQALRRLPPDVDQVDGAMLVLARAFAVEYDAGRFDNAFRIAAIEAGAFPDKTSARDRLIAAAIKRIELACEADEPRRALAVVDAVGATVPRAVEFTRLERRAYPGIAAAAVRRDDWQLAHEIGARYAVAQPDEVESARLSEWIESRRHPGRPPRLAGADTPPIILY